MDNRIYRKKGGCISWLPNKEGFGQTAIVLDNGSFYVLNGDFREQYKDKTILQCLQFFEENQDENSRWSRG